jgi:competence protein ComEA
MGKMKRAITFGIGFLVAWIVVRLIAEYLQTVRSQYEQETVTLPAYRRPSPPPPPEASEPDQAVPETVNLNAADVEALITLPGVGSALAARIVAHREQSGAFDSVDDLVQVNGIGPTLLERLRTEVAV